MDKHPTLGVQVTVFDSVDGVRSNLVFSGLKPRVAKTADGRLWFLPVDGVSVVVSGRQSPAVEVAAHGDAHDLNPIGRNEACRIAREALRNAFRHAQAQRITVQIDYQKRNSSCGSQTTAVVLTRRR